MGTDIGRMNGAGVGLGSDIGIGRATGAGGSDGVLPWFDGFGVPPICAAPKNG